MNHKVKALGMALAAVLVVGIIATPAASAEEFHSESAHTIISGEQPAEYNDVFTFNAGTVTCKTVSYSGTTSAATVGDVSVTPKYSECTAFGFVSSPVDVNGCRFKWTWRTLKRLVIICEVVSWIVTAFNCYVKVGSQETATGVTYDNGGSGTTRDVTVTSNISGLKYTQESKSFPGCTNGTFTNGTYKGAVTLKGADTEGKHVGVWST